jgi:glycosyltransferase involved in cell wall biosynthesis
MTVFITTPNSDTYNNPTILGLLQKLDKNQIKVVVIAPSNTFKNPIHSTIHINLRNFNLGLRSITLFKELAKACIYYSTLLWLLLKYSPNLIIGVDPEGVVFGRKIQQLASSIGKSKIKLDYLSFEIFFKDEGAKKDNELNACNYINNLIIQDEERDKLLRTENQIPDSVPTYYIPVAPLINQEKLQHYTSKRIPFREQHNISPDKKLVIAFGSFAGWSGADWMLNTISNTTAKNCVFVIHSRYRLNEQNYYDKKLIEASKENKQIIFSNDYIASTEEAVAFLQQFDLGFVLYLNGQGIYTGKNIYHIGYASGKFSHFMAAGVPVITNNLPIYRKLNEQHGFGFVVENEQAMTELLEQAHDFTAMKSNCKTLFNNFLNPCKALDNYICYVKGL